MMDPIQDPRLREEVRSHPYPLLFATVSGAHLYGFPSPDSDYDLRGVHVLPVRELLGLTPARETVDHMADRDGVEMDLVTHDVAKFFRLLLRPNGYVLEQLYSPLVVLSTRAHRELVQIARGCITRWHVKHYEGFAKNQWQLFTSESPPRIKPLLYVFRVLCTGIHLMRTGEVESDLSLLLAEQPVDGIAELIDRKKSGGEQDTLDPAEIARHAQGVEGLRAELEAEGERTSLPAKPTCRAELERLLIAVRLEPDHWLV